MYEENSEEILKRMKNNINNDLSKGQGTYINANLSTLSIELEKQNKKLNDVLNRVFIESALKHRYEKEVVERCAEHGVFRKQGTKALGTVTVLGAQGTIIPKGFLVQTKNNIQFKTIEEKIINSIGEIDIPIEAIEIGSKYNVKANTIVETPIQIVGVSSVTNKEDIKNGYDTESIEELYRRYKIQITTPATSGNPNHYKMWAMEVQGVGNADVKSLWDGPGTVKVIIIDSNKNTPSQELINNVKEHIEEERPIGATVTVVGMEEVLFDINVNVEIDTSATLEEVKDKIENNISEYFSTTVLEEKIIRYTRIASCILNALGVIDYSDLTINNNTENIKLNDEQIAVLDSVVVNSV
ncbi:baseplate J/gp47 family protein [Clostridium tetani]|uniref:baseplate J/gp47 family protein n=1 Tax=Clostridium tetani TaxID=1513 RepID=UPI001025D458|nr:baseplate J/gp47 family protein [Clostridium tetani]RXI70494.1 terminase [Clostridium tetani]